MKKTTKPIVTAKMTCQPRNGLIAGEKLKTGRSPEAAALKEKPTCLKQDPPMAHQLVSRGCREENTRPRGKLSRHRK